MPYNTIRAAEEQSKLNPDEVIRFLKQGNAEFISNIPPGSMEDIASGQFPKAIILACIDSRVPGKDIFQCDIGDLFVVRVAGNIINPDILGSMEIACKVFGSKLIVVVGHNHCSAIQSAINEVELGNITGILSKIKPAVHQTKINFKGKATSSNPVFIEAVCHTNVELMVNEIRKNSLILKEMEDNNQIKIVGAMYNIEKGTVDFFEDVKPLL